MFLSKFCSSHFDIPLLPLCGFKCNTVHQSVRLRPFPFAVEPMDYCVQAHRDGYSVLLGSWHVSDLCDIFPTENWTVFIYCWLQAILHGHHSCLFSRSWSSATAICHGGIPLPVFPRRINSVWYSHWRWGEFNSILSSARFTYTINLLLKPPFSFWRNRIGPYVSNLSTVSISSNGFSA